MFIEKLKLFKVDYMRVGPFVHVVFLFGLTHNFKDLCCLIHDKLKEFRRCNHILGKYDENNENIFY